MYFSERSVIPCKNLSCIKNNHKCRTCYNKIPIKNYLPKLEDYNEKECFESLEQCLKEIEFDKLLQRLDFDIDDSGVWNYYKENSFEICISKKQNHDEYFKAYFDLLSFNPFPEEYNDFLEMSEFDEYFDGYYKELSECEDAIEFDNIMKFGTWSIEQEIYLIGLDKLFQYDSYHESELEIEENRLQHINTLLLDTINCNNISKNHSQGNCKNNSYKN